MSVSIMFFLKLRSSCKTNVTMHFDNVEKVQRIRNSYNILWCILFFVCVIMYWIDIHYML